MSPSITERVAEVRRQERQKAAEEAEKTRRLYAQQQAKEQTKLRQQKDTRLGKEQKVRGAERQRLEKISSIYKTSGVHSMLQEVQTGLNQNGIYKNDLLVSRDRSRIKLVWGNKYRTTRQDDGNVEVVYDKGLLGLSQGIVDYSEITVFADPSKMQLHIAGAESHVIQTDRLSDRPFIEDVLIDCFKRPGRVNGKEPQQTYYDSSSSTNTECCNS